MGDVETAERLARIESSMIALKESFHLLTERLQEHMKHEDALLNHATIATDRMSKLELGQQELKLKHEADINSIKQRLVFISIIIGLASGSGGTIITKLLGAAG